MPRLRGRPDVEKLEHKLDTAGLISALKYTDVDVQICSARALARLGDARAVEPLIAALTKGHTSVQPEAAAALGQLGEKRAIEPLIRALGHPWTRDAAEKALVPFGAAAVGPLVQALPSGFADEILKRIGAPAIEPLVAALGDGDTELRRSAARVLGEIRDARAVQPLIGVLRADNDSSVRNFAAKALGFFKNDDAVDPLIAALRDRDPDVGASAAASLGRLGHPAGVEPLLAVLSIEPSSEEALRRAIEGHPDEFRSEPAAAALIYGSLEKSASTRLRVNAIRALRNLADSRAIEPLSRCLDDDDPEVRKAARSAFEKLGAR